MHVFVCSLLFQDVNAALLANDSLSAVISDSAVVQPITALPLHWPAQGSITFRDVSMSYRDDLPPAISHVSFHIAAGEHLGIVGRTGAGKSSIFQALFRMRPLLTGSILIDEVPITAVRRRYLRQRLSIIPQSPVLFSGTIRDNLDPFNRCSDHDIWHALQQCHIANKIRALENG